MWNKSPNKLKTVIALGIPTVVLLAMAAFLITSILMPYIKAENTMDPNGTVVIRQQDDGSLLVTWPAGKNAESHTLQVLGADNRVLYSCDTGEQCSAVLPADLPTDQTVTISISSFCSYRKKQRPGKETLQVKTMLLAPAVSALNYTVDPDTDRLDVTYTMPQGAICQVFSPAYENGSKPVLELTESAFSLNFGSDQQFEVPSYDETCDFTFKVQQKQKNLEFYGNVSGSLQVCREDFLGTVLKLQSKPLGSNSYRLYWNQTKGDNYRLETSRDGNTWEEVYAVANDGKLSYVTAHMEPFTTCYYRVVALNDAGQVSAEPSSVQLQTAQRTVYSTVWPLKELEVYSDSSKQTVLGTLTEGTACCVLEETDGMFRVAYGDGTGYIDSHYCLINLPQYMGNLCVYDITNSYASAYMVHEFTIDQVTGQSISGYENIRLSDDSYVVPLLYPTAQKLLVAAQSAREQGYRLKICDAFRPRNATLSTYSVYEEIMDTLIPKSAYTGVPVTDLDEMRWVIAEDIPDWVITGYKLDRNGERVRPKAPQMPTANPENPEEDPFAAMTDEQFQKYYLMREMTYVILMTDNGRYQIEDYIARGMSEHNMGIALDVTLETLDGEPVQMQTKLHDLSWYSETARNNEAANILQDIMVGAGFESAPARWWHFQDGDSKDNLELTALFDGVSVQGWVKDDQGWRYQLSNGRFLKNCTEQLDGKSYTFDENGYTSYIDYTDNRTDNLIDDVIDEDTDIDKI